MPQFPNNENKINEIQGAKRFLSGSWRQTFFYWYNFELHEIIMIFYEFNFTRLPYMNYNVVHFILIFREMFRKF